MRTLTQETSLCQGQPSCLVTFGIVHLERLRGSRKILTFYCMVYKLVLPILNESNPPCVLHVDTPSKQTGGALARFLEQHRHSERMKMFGPFTMGIGIFIFICANAILHENRDRETKVGLKASAEEMKHRRFQCILRVYMLFNELHKQTESHRLSCHETLIYAEIGLRKGCEKYLKSKKHDLTQ